MATLKELVEPAILLCPLYQQNDFEVLGGMPRFEVLGHQDYQELIAEVVSVSC